MVKTFSTTSAPLVEAHALTKQFGPVQALAGLDFRVMPGEIYGLLGPNGAGKTTTIKIIAGLLEPTSGWVKVGGFNPIVDPIEVKSRIGYVAEKPILYESLSAREFLEFVASIRKIEQDEATHIATQLANAFDMIQYFDSPIGALSLGMKQKVALVASLFHRPPILLLDEPLNGLDAKSSRIVKDLVALHAQNGGAMIFSTHVMEVAEYICTRICIIHQGKMIAEGTFDELKSKAEGEHETLEEVFLSLTNERGKVVDMARILVEAFCRNEVG